MDEVPELPDWIQVLIEDARSEGFNAGVIGGTDAAWESMRKITEDRGVRWGRRW